MEKRKQLHLLKDEKKDSNHSIFFIMKHANKRMHLTYMENLIDNNKMNTCITNLL